MTSEEKQEIVNAVLASLRSNSAQITDLTEVSDIPGSSFIEISGGKRISADSLISLIEGSVTEGVVNPVIVRVSNLETTMGTKFNIADIVEQLGNSANKVLSQRYLSSVIEQLGQDIAGKIAQSNITDSSGDSTSLVMSQKGATLLAEALSTQLGNIDFEVSLTNNGYSIKFTDKDGTTATYEIGLATTSTLGLLSAADKQALEGLKDAKVVGLRLERETDNVCLVLRNDGTGDAYSITIPTAGTIGTGSTTPVAGVMSAQQAADLEAVVLEVFPLVASVSSSNAGYYERGSSVTPDVRLDVTRRGVGIASEVSVSTNMDIVDTQGHAPADDVYLEAPAISSDTTYNIAVSHQGSTITLPNQQYKFVSYVYGSVLDEAPEDIAAACANATLQELSNRTTYSGKLAANKLFFFAIPGAKTLVCRHAETGATIACTKGTATIERQNGSSSDLYSYIIVPASDIEWNFQITNS